jgi:type I restriction enzyme S subunit
MAAGSSVKNLNKEKVSSLLVTIPPMEEQKAIATALSDVDELIVNLEKLIEKKKAIKQGTMQELLTGKKRLPGFNGEWKEYTLGELLAYEQPTKYIVQSTKYSEQGIPVLTAGKSLVLGYTLETEGVYDNLPVIIFDDFVTSSKYIDYRFKVKSSAMKMLTLKKDGMNLRLIFELMQMIDFIPTDHQRHWISRYSKFNIKMPESFKEQNAIAAVLADMDDEINELNSKLEKYRLVKQGMMQKLLTGEIRLV